MINKDIYKKKLIKRLLLGLIAGIALLTYGMFRIIFIEPIMGINLKTQMPAVTNGSLPIVLGMGLIIGCYISIRNRKKIIDDEFNNLNSKMKRKKSSKQWLKHY